MSNKKILIVIDNAFVERSLLFSDFFTHIKDLFQEVVLVVPDDKRNYFVGEYGSEKVTIDVMRKEKDGFFEKYFFLLLKYSIHSTANKVKLIRNIIKENGEIKVTAWFIYFCPIMLSWYLSKYSLWRKLLQFVFIFIPNDKVCLAILENHKPDIIYARYSAIGVKNFNLKLFKAAKKLNILTVGNIFSWDNLYSKIFITSHTDKLTVPNEIIRNDAINIGDFKKEKIKIIGIPHFDYYYDKELLLSREGFMKSIGADPNKKLILYTAGVKEVISYKYFFRFFENISKDILPGTQFYLRPHPKRKFDERLIKEFKKCDNLIFEVKLDEEVGNNFKMSKKNNQFLTNLLHHSSAMLCSYSTILIEACIMDLPTININYSGDRKQSYFYDIKKYAEWEHIIHLMKNKGIIMVESDEELVKALKKYLDNPSLDSEERIKIVKQQAHFTEGKAAKEAAQFLYECS